jgi:hypothetical protein
MLSENKVKGYLPCVSDWRSSAVRASYALSAATIALFIALCVPLILGTFMNPGLQPINAPPGNASLGTHWREKAESSIIKFHNVKKRAIIGKMHVHFCNLAVNVFT